MSFNSTKPMFMVAVLISSTMAWGQSELQKRTLVINGQSGEATIYHINGQSYVDLETLARIGNGTLSFRGRDIILTLPVSDVAAAPSNAPLADSGMSAEFMRSAVQALSIIKEWHTTLAHAIQRGAPGDGSRLVVFHDRAAEGLRLATVAASSSADQDALKVLNNHFNQVDSWTRKLIKERKAMSTGNYSMTPNALDNDSEYQKIVSCGSFLGKMLIEGRYSYDGACH
jgi:hypothetical protein